MLQALHMDVAYVAMVVHRYCKLLFPMFHLFFRCMLQVYLSGRCICFTYMLKMLYLDITYICNVSSVFRYFRYMLRVFHLSSDVCCKSIFKSLSKSHSLNHNLESHLHENRFLYIFTLQRFLYISCIL
jgi:hypothetical protein